MEASSTSSSSRRRLAAAERGGRRLRVLLGPASAATATFWLQVRGCCGAGFFAYVA
jgi:hypothetical protein